MGDLMPATFNGCFADVDGNGVVNAAERGSISANIGRMEDDLRCLFDLDGNGFINAADRGFVSASIGLCLPLPDYQNGSGLNRGAPDPRFPAGGDFHVGMSCGQTDCVNQSCSELSWSSGVDMPGAGWRIRAFVAFDDGTGPALYAGGGNGGVTSNGVAKWDGTTWLQLVGPNGHGVNDYVFALTVFDDGTGPALYAGGKFTTAGGLTANRVAKWDGAAWSPLVSPSGNGLNADVLALTVFDDGTGPALYAGGEFTTAWAVNVSHIAKWDGTAWSPLLGPGDGVNGSVRALTVFDDGTGPALYVGGAFTTAGGLTTGSVAKWDGTAWSALSSVAAGPSNGTVQELTAFDDGGGNALYAAGSFNSAGGVPVNRIAKWDGSAWSPLVGPNGTGVDANVYALAVFNDGAGPALYAGGDFLTAGGVQATLIAKWDGTRWSGLISPSSNGLGGDWSSIVNVLAVFDDGAGPALYAAGNFSTAGGLPANSFARWGCAP